MKPLMDWLSNPLLCPGFSVQCSVFCKQFEAYKQAQHSNRSFRQFSWMFVFVLIVFFTGYLDNAQKKLSAFLTECDTSQKKYYNVYQRKCGPL